MDKTVENLKQLPPRPGNEKRAWNDPPLLGYSNGPQALTSGYKLNRRVAFPFDGNLPNNSVTVLQNEHTQPIQMSPAINSIFKESIALNDELPDQDELFAIFRNCVTKCVNSDKEPLDQVKSEELCKRISDIESKWLNNEFNEVIKSSLVKIAAALQKGDYEAADAIQIQLAVDWSSDCGSWIVVIRNLVRTLSYAHKSSNM